MRRRPGVYFTPRRSRQSLCRGRSLTDRPARERRGFPLKLGMFRLMLVGGGGPVFFRFSFCPRKGWAGVDRHCNVGPSRAAGVLWVRARRSSRSSRPRPASLPAEGWPSSWSFVIRASATELVRAPRRSSGGRAARRQYSCVTLFLSPCGGLSSPGAVLSPGGGTSTPRPFAASTRHRAARLRAHRPSSSRSGR